MNKVRQKDNSISLINEGIQTYVSSATLVSTTSRMPVPSKPMFWQPSMRPCVIVFFSPPDGMTYQCDDLVDINDVIAEYTSSERGKKLLRRAEDELNRELFEEVRAGTLSKVKYYRLVNNMDQKTLACLSGIKQPNISRLEKLGYKADTDTYKKLAKVFNINYKELLP